MIISITGKPCSGKGTVSKIICNNHNFEYICTGDIFRNFTKEFGFANILEFQQSEKVYDIDKLVDNKTIEIGKTRLKDNIVFDSRLAWHFIPKSYKVFVDVSWDEAANRLISANRSSEQVSNIIEAKNTLINRWEVENKRYSELYNINNLDLNNYDLVVSSDNKTPEEVAEEIYSNYLKFIKNSK